MTANLKALALAAKKVIKSGTWQWYWRKEDRVADCGVFVEPSPGHAYSVCRCPNFVEREQWEATGAFFCAANPDAVLALIEERDALREAATTFLDRYTALVHSGDCGNWDPETEADVIALRAALAKVPT